MNLDRTDPLHSFRGHGLDRPLDWVDGELRARVIAPRNIALAMFQQAGLYGGCGLVGVEHDGLLAAHFGAANRHAIQLNQAAAQEQ